MATGRVDLIVCKSETKRSTTGDRIGRERRIHTSVRMGIVSMKKVYGTSIIHVGDLFKVAITNQK